MTKVSVQFCRFDNEVPSPPGESSGAGGSGVGMPSALGTRVELTATSAATAGGSRPLNPADGRFTHAIVIPITGEVLCEAGADPTATQESRYLPLAGLEYVVRCAPGHRLSFILRTP